MASAGAGAPAAEPSHDGSYGTDRPPAFSVELWTHPADILRQLSFPEAVRVTAVCKTWRAAAETAIVQRSYLDLRWTRGAHQLARAVRHVADKFAPRWSKLRSVSLFGSSVSLALLTELRECLAPQLAHICIESKTLTDAGLHVLAACTDLRTFRVPNCPRITSEGVAAVFACASRLEEVDVSRCSRVTDDAVSALARHCPHLRSLNLAQCFRVTNTSLRHLAAAHCRTALTHLNTDRCLKLTSRGVGPLGDAASALRAVDFSSCLKLSDGGVAAVAAGSAAALTSVNLSGCSGVGDAAVEAIVAHAGARLTFLSVAGCERLTPASLHLLHAAHCPRLSAVVLSKLPAAVTDDVLAGSVATLPLRCLAVNGCVQVTDDGVAAVAAGAGAATLHTLSLEYCYLCGDASLDALAAHCAASLTHLNVRICNRMSVAGFRRLAAACTALAAVKLSGVHTQSDTTAIVGSLHAALPDCAVCL